MKVPFFLTFIFFTLISSTKQTGKTITLDKIEHQLVSAFEKKVEARYFILLNQRADLRNIKKSLQKKEKGAAIYRSLVNNARRTQTPVIDFLQKNGIQYKALKIVNAIVVSTDFVTAKKIVQLQGVRKLIYDPAIRIDDGLYEKEIVHERTAGEPEWGIQSISATKVWHLGYQGQGIVVGGADTGYEWTHSTLKSQYRGNIDGTIVHDYNWHDAIHSLNPINQDTSNNPSHNPCGLDVPYPCDDLGHGTHTMGTMVGQDSVNLIGVAPKAKWIACRNMDRGWGSPSSYIECFEWFLAPTDLNGENADPSAAPDVINNSWRCPPKEGCSSDNFGLLQEAIQVLKSAGIFVVVSAGNEGPGCASVDSPPAFFTESFSVGALQFNDAIAPFSSRGPATFVSSDQLKPDITAPGVNVRSAFRFGGFATTSGTSMAGPHVAGTVALILSANPELKGQPDVIEELLINHATGMQSTQDCGNIDGSSIPNNTFGYGKLNAYASVLAALDLTVKIENKPLIGRIQLTPNPAQNIVRWYSRGNPVTSFQIFSLAGETLRESNINSDTKGTIDISSIAEGIYIIRFQGQDQLMTGKIVIAR